MELLNKINETIVNPVIGLIFALAFLVFLWGVFEFVMHADSEEGRQQGAQHMIWGIIGVAIMISVWGIINFIQGTVEGFR